MNSSHSQQKASVLLKDISVGQIFLVYLQYEKLYWPAKVITVPERCSSRQQSTITVELYNFNDSKQKRQKRISINLENTWLDSLIAFESVYHQWSQKGPGDQKWKEKFNENKRFKTAMGLAVKDYEQRLKTPRMYNQLKKQSERLKNGSKKIIQEESNRSCYSSNKGQDNGSGHSREKGKVLGNEKKKGHSCSSSYKCTSESSRLQSSKPSKGTHQFRNQSSKTHSNVVSSTGLGQSKPHHSVQNRKKNYSQRNSSSNRGSKVVENLDGTISISDQCGSSLIGRGSSKTDSVGKGSSVSSNCSEKGKGKQKRGMEKRSVVCSNDDSTTKLEQPTKRRKNSRGFVSVAVKQSSRTVNNESSVLSRSGSVGQSNGSSSGSLKQGGSSLISQTAKVQGKKSTNINKKNSPKKSGSSSSSVVSYSSLTNKFSKGIFNKNQKEKKESKKISNSKLNPKKSQKANNSILQSIASNKSRGRSQKKSNAMKNQPLNDVINEQKSKKVGNKKQQHSLTLNNDICLEEANQSNLTVLSLATKKSQVSSAKESTKKSTRSKKLTHNEIKQEEKQSKIISQSQVGSVNLPVVQDKAVIQSKKKVSGKRVEVKLPPAQVKKSKKITKKECKKQINKKGVQNKVQQTQQKSQQSAQNKGSFMKKQKYGLELSALLFDDENLRFFSSDKKNTNTRVYVKVISKDGQQEKISSVKSISQLILLLKKETQNYNKAINKDVKFRHFGIKSISSVDKDLKKPAVKSGSRKSQKNKNGKQISQEQQDRLMLSQLGEGQWQVWEIGEFLLHAIYSLIGSWIVMNSGNVYLNDQNYREVGNLKQVVVRKQVEVKQESSVRRKSSNKTVKNSKTVSHLNNICHSYCKQIQPQEKLLMTEIGELIGFYCQYVVFFCGGQKQTVSKIVCDDSVLQMLEGCLRRLLAYENVIGKGMSRVKAMIPQVVEDVSKKMPEQKCQAHSQKSLTKNSVSGSRSRSTKKSQKLSQASGNKKHLQKKCWLFEILRDFDKLIKAIFDKKGWLEKQIASGGRQCQRERYSVDFGLVRDVSTSKNALMMGNQFNSNVKSEQQRDRALLLGEGMALPEGMDVEAVQGQFDIWPRRQSLQQWQVERCSDFQVKKRITEECQQQSGGFEEFLKSVLNLRSLEGVYPVVGNGGYGSEGDLNNHQQNRFGKKVQIQEGEIVHNQYQSGSELSSIQIQDLKHQILSMFDEIEVELSAERMKVVRSY